jgi:hypothetical protein
MVHTNELTHPVRARNNVERTSKSLCETSTDLAFGLYNASRNLKQIRLIKVCPLDQHVRRILKVQDPNPSSTFCSKVPILYYFPERQNVNRGRYDVFAWNGVRSSYGLAIGSRTN